jgi:hypothetical protein
LAGPRCGRRQISVDVVEGLSCGFAALAIE